MAVKLKSGTLNLIRSNTARALLSLAVVFLIGIIFNADGAFYKWGTHRDMLRQISVFGMLACGMTIVIITSGIDLSVGSLLGFSAVVFAMTGIHFGWPAWLAIAACLAAGTALGAISGALIAGFRIQPFIATLAMMVFARGLAKFVSGGQKISTAVAAPDGSYKYVDIPPVFEFLNSKVLGGNLSVVTILFVICLLISWVILSKLRWGRYIYAIGGNEEASRLSGVPVRFIKTFAYAVSGLFCALAGICQAAQEIQGDPEAGFTYELTAIAIVVIGGTSLRGGSGGIWLTLVGTLTIGYLEKVLSINAVGEAARLMLTGVIIIAAVMLQKRDS